MRLWPVLLYGLIFLACAIAWARSKRVNDLAARVVPLLNLFSILAAIGVSVDAQIIVTDELLKKEEETRKRLDKAFGIITTSVMVAVVAMLPLLLMSGLVEIIGFATSTVLGSLLGLFISRPAYGVMAERIFE